MGVWADKVQLALLNVQEGQSGAKVELLLWMVQLPGSGSPQQTKKEGKRCHSCYILNCSACECERRLKLNDIKMGNAVDV